MTDWLQLARETFEASSSYLDANHRKAIERNISLFQSKHPTGSKYNSQAYKARSRLFRPKTKSVVRKNEAAAAAAFFANVDVVAIEPENDADPMQVVSALVHNELLNYRLTKTIPWFMTLIGALQTAQVEGVVASYQYWKYKEKTRKVYEPLLDDMGQPMIDGDGNPYMQESEAVDVIEDKPCIELIPFERFRFDPGADWTDVVGSSPYFIRLVPMYVDNVLGMMQEPNPKTGQPKWKKYDEDTIRSAMVDYDSIRQQREGKREDPLVDNNASLGKFEIVWCHENFVRIDGEEKVYWTLGTHHLLTEPVALKEAYFHGQRPFVLGCAVLEAFKAIPESLVAIGSEMQKEINETVNQRRDNVSLVLNKRYKARRNAQVDIDALTRNVPGGVVMMTNPETDVIEMPTIDVTGSAFQEQDRLNVDYDELTGNFSQSSVATSRNLNETVGGMKMLGGSAGQMTEYLIRTFVETWVEPVLRQLVKLEQHYETDTVLLGLMGQKAQIQRYGVNQLTDELLNQELTVRVNVGMGATDPHQKLGRFMFALKTYGEAMQMIPDADPEAIRREVFGLVGYKDGNRFFANQQTSPMLARAQQMIQELQGELGKAQAEANKAKAMGPAADLARQAQEIEFKKALLGLQEKIAALSIKEKAMDTQEKMGGMQKSEDNATKLQQEMIRGAAQIVVAQLGHEASAAESEQEGAVKRQEHDVQAMMVDALGVLAKVVESTNQPKGPTRIRHERDAEGRIVTSTTE